MSGGVEQGVSARVVIEVQAGLIPGEVMAELTKRWAVSSAEWENAFNRARGNEGDEGQAAKDLLDERYDQAIDYARHLQYLSATGYTCNWVRIDWIWR